jgi:hypothetical protein
MVVAPGRVPAGARVGGLYHVTDWLPTLVSAGGAELASLGPQFARVDGIDQWGALTAPGGPPPRSELLHNIEGVRGSGVGVVRVGELKLLRRMQTARGFDGWCDVCDAEAGCEVPAGAGPAKNATTVAHGGALCCWAPPANDTCQPTNRTPALPDVLLYNISADPRELVDLAPSQPADVARLLARLDAYNATNEPCCICTGSGRTPEMDLAPLDGFWMSFRDQSPNPDPNCALLNQPPWRSS